MSGTTAKNQGPHAGVLPTASPSSPVYVHPQALCESKAIGAGTRLWAFSHVMEGAIVGSECNIGEGVFVESGAVVGDRVTVKNQAAIWDGVQIDDDVFIGPAVMFTNDRYPRSPRMQAVAERYQSPHNWRQTTHVGRGASLGAGAIILPGVCVGEYAVVGAASVVSSDVAPHQLVVGNPARPHGWACICGHRLAVELCCLSCGRRYRRQNEGLVPEGTD